MGSLQVRATCGLPEPDGGERSPLGEPLEAGDVHPSAGDHLLSGIVAEKVTVREGCVQQGLLKRRLSGKARAVGAGKNTGPGAWDEDNDGKGRMAGTWGQD